VRSLSTTLAVARSKAIENLHFRRHLEIFDHCRCYSAERRPKEEIAPLSISSNSFWRSEAHGDGNPRGTSADASFLRNQYLVCKDWPPAERKARRLEIEDVPWPKEKICVRCLMEW